MAELVTGTSEDGTRSVTVSGEVDIADVDALLAAAIPCLAETPAALVVDLGEVTFIDSSGLGALVRIRNAAHEAGKDLVLARVPDAVSRLLQISGLADSFTVRAKD